MHKIKKYQFGKSLDINYQLPSVNKLAPNLPSLTTTTLMPPSMPLFKGSLGNHQINDIKNLNFKIDERFNKPNTTSIIAKNLGDLFVNFLSGTLSDGLIGDDSELGRSVGNIMSGALGTAGSTIIDNISKGNVITEGLQKNVGSTVSGIAGGLAANYAGQGISSLMGNSNLGRFTGGAASSALGQILGGGVGNPINFASNVLGAGLSAMTGPSKEYGGKYGNVTQTMDAIYGTAQGVVGMMGPVGAAISAGMALNKGLSNIFGSTSGMTIQDSILGSAFMPAPVKWLNMAGAKTTSTFGNLSWQNTEKANTFMGNAFGNLSDRFDKAREEAGKTYGTFSRGAYNKALDNINFANYAWNKVLAMADQNELQNIRSLYMTSINNLRYALNIQGGWNPLAVGKQGMKILNNATNHNMGMRLLSAAALIDDKQMILSALTGTKLYDFNRGNKDNIFKYTNSNGDVRYVYRDNPEDEEIPVRPLNTIFPDPAQWTFTDDAGRFYTPRRTTTANIAELNPDNRTGFERVFDNYIGEAFNTVPKGYHTLPAIGAAAFGLANPVLGEAALTSGFGAHGLSKWMNGEINSPLNAAMTAVEITPLGRVARPIWNAGKEIVYNTADRYIFMPHSNSFTRGIGMTDAGLQDAVTTGVFRGNPRGTEVTAKQFTKLFEKNRDNFRDIMDATGIEGIASKFQSRTLSETEFNAIKEAAKKYKMKRLSFDNGNISPIELPADPLYEYPDYASYVKSVNETIANVEKMPSRIASGEIKVNTELTPTVDGVPHGRPIEERFGPNSDYVGDGQPLSYWYDDGRNPLTRGHSYAKSNYGVRVNNPEDYTPFMHELHLHPSFFKTPQLADPNVEIFGKGPLGLTIKLDKETLQPVWKRDLSNMFRRGETIKTPQITSENAVSEMPNIIRTVLDNGKIRLSLPSHTDNKPRQFVLEPAPEGNNKYYVHMRMWDDIENQIPASNVTNEEKQQLFDALYDELPEGAEILFPKSGPGFYGTRGTVAGLQRLAKDPRFTPGTRGTLLYLDKDGKTVRTYEGTSFIKAPRITSENAASITPEQWTAAQDAAIARGDMAEAQRLRDLHFKIKSGNDNTVFAHTTNAKFTEFDKSHFGETDEGFNGKGFYFSTTRIPEDPSIYSIAKGPKGEIPTMNYGKNKMYTYLKGDREFNVGNPERDFFEEPNTVGIVGKALDGRPHEVIIGNSNQIKLADAVTYDDKGVRIPLGERDNFKLNDIRYGWLPWFLGGSTAATLYNTNK